MAMTQRAALDVLAGEHVATGSRCGVNAQLKVPCLAAGMIAGAASIDDMDLLLPGRIWPMGSRRQNTPLGTASSAGGPRPITEH
jgi:hypothetical protein